jgi:CheY-like chemotaxis protein
VADDRDELGQAPFVLIVEDDPTFAAILLESARSTGMKGVVSTAGAGTLQMARKLRPTAITLDLNLADIDGLVLLDLLLHDPDTANLPVHVITGTDKAAAAVALGAFGVSTKPIEERELSEVFTNLLRAAKRPKRKGKPEDAKPQPTSDARETAELAGAKVLIVDDDIRNIFSLTSVLESYGVEVQHAERGKEGIAILEGSPDIDLALIDIMMPEMDGYETMGQIRQRPALADLPLIAVTAKAMKEDRQKCLDAGASDYIAKPVDIELLLALLRVWIARSRATAAARRGETAEAAE